MKHALTLLCSVLTGVLVVGIWYLVKRVFNMPDLLAGFLMAAWLYPPNWKERAS